MSPTRLIFYDLDFFVLAGKIVVSSIHQGFLIKIFNIRDTTVRANNIINAPVYPPVISNTLFDAVATKEPTITVKVIRAILFEKFFIPKNDEVNAAVIVGQAP